MSAVAALALEVIVLGYFICRSRVNGLMEYDEQARL
jgi:hypothetical protein